MFTCNLCGKKFKNKFSFGGHVGSHNRRSRKSRRWTHAKPGNLHGMRSFWICTKCGKVMSKGSTYAGHMRRHKSFERNFSELPDDRSRKKRLLHERGHRCEVCRLTMWMKKQIPLEIDHIDGHCTNNERSNLRLICPNCHAQTDTYKGKNIGNVSGKRKERYEKYPIANYRRQKKEDGR